MMRFHQFQKILTMPGVFSYNLILIFPKFVLISTNLYFLAPYDKADTHNNTNKQTVLIPLLFLESQHPSRGGNYRPSLVRQ